MDFSVLSFVGSPYSFRGTEILQISRQKRLCLVPGWAVEPETIPGDEAIFAPDPISSKTMEELFLSIKDKYTVVPVTHTLPRPGG